MNQEIANLTLQMLNNWGKIVSDGSQAVFELYTKQCFVEGIINVVFSLIIILSIIIVF